MRYGSGERGRECLSWNYYYSPAAKNKARTKRTPDNLAVHSFPSLLRDLATITRNTIQPLIPGVKPFDKTTLPTIFQRRAFDLLQVTIP